ncbi:hypothetical protein CAPTEDRAFT_193200 [Capitella teleta]|uniref:Methyltransferase n=1 Tax=Capitella teleta TaxID=283909 RepID=R7UV52_CAPTE|nr:hypothetical protein CAPTEDRAFT_193200 [Capitella teleta]|eukprot:ELU07827.1 hypothetical protein CAPTEDRAFT_193200 [Capitella teleta]
MTNHYYDLVTDFYEYGWGDSFHFATQDKGESREHSFAKHEYRLALKLGIQKGETVLDIGCGIGGPARSIAAFSECKVIGLNCNEYQIKRAEFRTRRIGLQNQCSFVKGDFNDIPFPCETFKRVYAVEATCHAVTLEQVYSEVFRVLKPGGVFANYEWIVTDKFNPNDPHHLKIKDDILEGDALPELRTAAEIVSTLRRVGFEVQEAEDWALKSQIPWWSELSSTNWSLTNFKSTPAGRWMTHLALVGMEMVGLATKGSVKTHHMLCKGADACALGGKEGIFSPMLLLVARKPTVVPHTP